MPRTFLFDDTYKVLNKSMDVASRRHSLISANIANMDTVGYQPRDLDFQKTLEAEMRKGGRLSGTHSRHYSQGAGSPMDGEIRESGDEINLDPVNIDTEMGNLLENNMKYRSSIEMMMRKMTILKHAIAEGGR